MSRKGESITLSLQERDKEQLKAIATELGMTWGDKPNISKLVEAIARRQVLVCPNHDWSRDRITFLNQARLALIDAGQTDAALELARLLLERSELAIPLRQEIQQFVDRPIPAWRQAIDRFIHQQHPFQLSYRDAADRPFRFTIYHARITPYEKRLYLECWCQETVSNQDIPALSHNWCLRLDRIAEAAIAPIKGPWRPNLDHVDVTLHILHGLAFAYASKPDDISNQWLADAAEVREVVRRISNTFWFLREILRYGADCYIVSPDAVRDRLKKTIHDLAELYSS